MRRLKPKSKTKTDVNSFGTDKLFSTVSLIFAMGSFIIGIILIFKKYQYSYFPKEDQFGFIDSNIFLASVILILCFSLFSCILLNLFRIIGDNSSLNLYHKGNIAIIVNLLVILSLLFLAFGFGKKVIAENLINDTEKAELILIEDSTVEKITYSFTSDKVEYLISDQIKTKPKNITKEDKKRSFSSYFLVKKTDGKTHLYEINRPVESKEDVKDILIVDKELLSKLMNE